MNAEAKQLLRSFIYSRRWSPVGRYCRWKWNSYIAAVHKKRKDPWRLAVQYISCSLYDELYHHAQNTRQYTTTHSSLLASLTQMKFVRLPVTVVSVSFYSTSRMPTVSAPIPWTCTFAQVQYKSLGIIAKCNENLANVYWLSLFVLRLRCRFLMDARHEVKMPNTFLHAKNGTRTHTRWTQQAQL